MVGGECCVLKGVVKGELLSAVGRDANNQIYPIAWAVVEYENASSWNWFLGHLQKDLNIPYGGDGWVFLTDQQKVFCSSLLCCSSLVVYDTSQFT